MFNVKEIVLFIILQFLLFKLSYFTHFNSEWYFYINLNTLKQFGFKVIIYYIKSNNFNNKLTYFIKSKIKLILFLNWLFKNIEIKYWLIKLEIISLI